MEKSHVFPVASYATYEPVPLAQEQKSYFGKISRRALGCIVAVGLLGAAMTVFVGQDFDSELENQSAFLLLTRPPLATGARPTALKPLEARVAGTDIPNNKRVERALQSIYGVGPHIAMKILTATEISPDIRAKDLTEEQLTALRDEVAKPEYIIEGDLRRNVRSDIIRLQEIRSYRGIRHRMGLPMRGQKTKNNARTRKGKRVAVAGKKK